MTPLNIALAAIVAALLTVFDLDETFYIPKDLRQRARLRLWMVAFVLANALLAAITYELIRGIDPFRSWNQSLAALVAGAGYLAIIRLKFTTFKWQGQDVPFGLELLYEGSKRFAYKRINGIAREARGEETRALANSENLAELVRRARLSISQDRLLSEDEKEQNKLWIVKVLEDDESDEMDKRLYIANYILSGDRS